MHKSVFVFALLLFSISAFTQKTIIAGVDTSHVGRTIAAFTPSDYISGKRVLLAQTVISDNGTFQLDLEVTEPREVQLVILHVQADMFVEPSHTYNIAFPAEGTADFKKFDRTEVQLDFGALPADDLNNLIRNFNTDYYTFVNEHYYDYAVEEFKGTPEFINRQSEKSKVDLYSKTASSDSLKKVGLSIFSDLVTAFLKETNEKYSKYYGNTYFKEYVRYSLAEIEMVAGLPKKLFYKEYFMSQKMQLLNPAYMRVFKVFYHDLLTDQTKEKNASVVKMVNAQRDPEKLIALFADDSTMLSKDIRTLAVIKGLKDIYFNKEFSRLSIEKTLGHLKDITDNAELKAIAANTYEQLKKNKEGWAQADFILLDEKEEKWQLADNSGIPVYIIFFASWSNASVKEMLLLEKLAETYEKDIRLVAINMDEKYMDFKKYIYDHPKQKFTFLYGYGDILLKENFNLKTVPHAVMLDPDLNVMNAFTPLPSQGIQANFAKLKQQAAASGQGLKTWDKK